MCIFILTVLCHNSVLMIFSVSLALLFSTSYHVLSTSNLQWLNGSWKKSVGNYGYKFYSPSRFDSLVGFGLIFTNACTGTRISSINEGPFYENCPSPLFCEEKKMQKEMKMKEDTEKRLFYKIIEIIHLLFCLSLS